MTLQEEYADIAQVFRGMLQTMNVPAAIARLFERYRKRGALVTDIIDYVVRIDDSHIMIRGVGVFEPRTDILGETAMIITAALLLHYGIILDTGCADCVNHKPLNGSPRCRGNMRVACMIRIWIDARRPPKKSVARTIDDVRVYTSDTRYVEIFTHSGRVTVRVYSDGKIRCGSRNWVRGDLRIQDIDGTIHANGTPLILTDVPVGAIAGSI